MNKIFLGLFLGISCFGTLAQDVSRPLKLREVAMVDLTSTSAKSNLPELNGGVIGIVFSCEPTSETAPATPLTLMLKSPAQVHVGQEFEIEIGIANTCETPIDFPIQTEFVAPVTKDVQHVSIVRAEASLENEDVLLEGGGLLYRSSDTPSTFVRMMKGDFVRLRMKVRARMVKSEIGAKPRQLKTDIRPVVVYWDRNSSRTENGSFGPLPTTTADGSWKEITILPEVPRGAD